MSRSIPLPIAISGPMKTVIYVGLAGTLVIGIYPQPFTDWVVSATLMFANFIGPSADGRSSGSSARRLVSASASQEFCYNYHVRHEFTAWLPYDHRSVLMHIILIDGISLQPSLTVSLLSGRGSLHLPPPLLRAHLVSTVFRSRGFTRLTIEHRVLAGFSLVFVGILIISAVSYHNTSILLTNRGLDGRSHDLIQLLNNVDAAMSEAEDTPPALSGDGRSVVSGGLQEGREGEADIHHVS